MKLQICLLVGLRRLISINIKLQKQYINLVYRIDGVCFRIVKSNLLCLIILCMCNLHQIKILFEKENCHLKPK